MVVYFFPRVLAGDFGFTKTTAMAVAAAVSVVQVAFGALLARLRVVDRFGRKPSVLCGIAGLIFGLACLAFGAHKRLPLLAVAGVAAFRLGFAASLGPLPYVVAAEVYSSSATRATGVSLATATQWACNALVSGTFLQMESSLGPTSVWLVYLAACVVAFVAVARVAPQTQNPRGGSEERYAEASGGGVDGDDRRRIRPATKNGTVFALFTHTDEVLLVLCSASRPSWTSTESAETRRT